RKAGSVKGQIRLLDRLGDRIVSSKSDSEDDTATSASATANPVVSGCLEKREEAESYFEDAVKLYPALIRSYPSDSNQAKGSREAYVGLLIKLGNYYL